MEDCAKNIIDISDIKLNSNTYLKSKYFPDISNKL